MHLRFLLHTLANALIVGGLLLLLLTLWPTLSSEGWYLMKRIERTINCRRQPLNCQRAPTSLFAPLASSPTPLRIEPVSPDFDLIIEKIGVNAPVIEDVPLADRAAYMEAMRHGVAHAQGSAKPGEEGNTYLFAHSSLNFWQLGKYATVFNLLRKLEPEDNITVFYQNKRYDYRVVNKEVISGFDLKPLLNQESESVLTLQTCHPPGTTLNRLIVTARLVSSEL